MQNLALCVFPDFKDDRVQPVMHPAYSQELLRSVAPSIKPVWPGEQLSRLLETYAAPWICSEAIALPRIESYSASDMTVIPL
jgi:hypothetical protein